MLLVFSLTISLSESIQELTTDDFDAVVMDQSKNVLVDFHSQTCAACKTVAPILEKVSEKFSSEDCVVAGVDTTTQHGIHTRFSVNKLPSFVFFSKEDKAGEFYEGEQTEAGFTHFLNEKCGTNNQ